MKVQDFGYRTACDTIHRAKVTIRRECWWPSEYVDITNLDIWRINLAMMKEEKAKLYWRLGYIEECKLIYVDISYTRNGEAGIRSIVSVDGDTD